MDFDVKLSMLKEKRSWINAGGVLIIGLLVLELFLRFFVYQKNENTIRTPDFKFQNKAGTVYFQALDGYGTTRYIANDEIETPYSNGRSVVVFGDSFTEAYQVNDDEKYVSIAEDLLYKRGIEANLHNFGKSDQKLVDQIWFYKYTYQKYKPEIAVFQLNYYDLIADDITDNGGINIFVNQSDGSLQVQHRPVSLESQNEIIRSIIRNSSLVGYGGIRFYQLKTLFENKYLKTQKTNLPTSDVHLINKETILRKISILKDTTAGVKLIIIITPPFPFIEKNTIIFDDPQYDELVSYLKEIPDILVIDPSTDFLNLLNRNQLPSGFNNSVLVGYLHWNKYGHMIVGQLLADALQEIIQ